MGQQVASGPLMVRHGPICRSARHRPGLRGKTILLAALGFLATFGVVTYYALTIHEAEIRWRLNERGVLAQAAAAHVDEHLGESLQLLEEVAGAVAAAPDRDLVAAALRNAQARPLLNGGLVIRDEEGHSLLAEPEFATLPQEDLAVQPTLTAARQTGQSAVSGLLQSPASRHPFVFIVTPIIGAEGRLRGFVQGRMDLDKEMTEVLLHPVSVGETGYSQLVDANGLVIAHSVAGRRFQRSTHADLMRRLIEEGKPRVEVFELPEGDEVELRREVVAFAPVTVARWGVAVEQGEAEAFASVSRLRGSILAVGGVALLAALGFAWMMMQRAVGPILALQRETARIAGGNLDAPVRGGGPDEIGDLARAFEHMRQKLKESHGTVEQLYQKSLSDNELLRKLDKLKTQMMATVSHDYRNPLAVVATLTDLMLAHSSDEATRHEFLQLIRSEVRRLSELVGDVLELSSIQSAETVLRREPVDLSEVVEYCVSMSQPGLDDGAERRFDVHIDPKTSVVSGDHGRLVEVVMNLIGNAIKYSPNGGAVAIRAQPLDGRPAVLLSIADQGIGIPPDAMHHLFEPFYRVKSVATEGIPGTGLGLAICRQIVEAHGGRIWVESEPGKGSVFHVALPSLSGEQQAIR